MHLLNVTERSSFSPIGSCYESAARPRQLPASRLKSRARRSPLSKTVQANMKTIITFDVDGTLIRAVGKDSNRLHKAAFAYAWQKVFNLKADIDEVQHHGLTDGLILVKMMEHHGTPKQEAMDRLDDMRGAMIEYFEEYKSETGRGLVLLPGILQLLKALQARSDVVFGLVTGNLEPIGWGKMEALGILDLFSRPLFGGFGSDFCSGDTVHTWKDRGELVRIARDRALKNNDVGELKASYHVGDTPMDVQAAEAGGAHAIGVLTGIFDEQALLAPGVKATILKDMEDTETVMRAFGLS
ncbi:hypothetical protein WJX73_003601 [Symbiochloris irregularis]|uniref:HAD family hydrolase n=1 Tax=Symbiochloris irregularis TaxID=706552 RepID=A0AAW1PA70_9CHLO